MVSDILGSTITVYSAKTTNGTEWGDANFVDAFYGTETQFYTYNLIDAISNYTIIEQSENLYEVFKTTDNGTVSESTQVLMGNDYQFDCDADNNLFFTWEQDNKVYAQGITDSNEMYWSSPVDVSSHNEEVIGVAENSNIQISNGINIIWNEVPNDSEIEVRIQKLSYDGNKMWGDDGILLSTMGDCFGENTIEELNEDYLVVGFAEQLDYTNYYKLNLISNESSVLYSENNGLALTGPGVSQYSLDLVSLTDNKLIAVWMQDYQNNRGIYAQMLDFNAVDNYTNETTPMTGILLQNYPNPFNPETNIFFQLPNSGHVRLDVYNIKGQKVKTLVNDRLNAGRHSVVWNGKDESNKQVASGLYLYKISSGKYTNTQKMVLMK